jgi:SAM-dependent MidA family methyltransferase
MAHSQRVSAFLHQQIAKAGGWIPFSEWMHHVLYAPGLGYYAAGNTKLADTQANATTHLSGDFVTAPQLTPLFGQTLARQIAEVLKQTNTAHVLEFGAGSGALAQDILEALDAQGLIVDYFILEVSADLKHRQQERLSRWGTRVQWLERAPEHFAGCHARRGISLDRRRCLTASRREVDSIKEYRVRECGVRESSARLYV